MSLKKKRNAQTYQAFTVLSQSVGTMSSKLLQQHISVGICLPPYYEVKPIKEAEFSKEKKQLCVLIERSDPHLYYGRLRLMECYHNSQQ
ncbi:hypothetical protein CDAR_38941 [Caerostris darwini]|uniref:Uncharacterized protein n=1 Tax=Caerostris darwini TaxID=1538125 RepID=A0AAV4UQX1_9ARAC|nr:hypothetical protein CDAR_38941 [Caerostris darwini]